MKIMIAQDFRDYVVTNPLASLQVSTFNKFKSNLFTARASM